MTTNGQKHWRCQLQKSAANESSTTIRRVRRPKDKEEMMARLSQGADSIFDTYVELLCFAACLGYARNASVPFESSAEAVPWHIFENRGKDSVVNLVAAVASEDFTIVGPDRFDDKLKVFEQYANGGLEILSQLIDKSPKTPFDVVRDLVLEAQRISPGSAASIDQMAKDLSWG
jgi:dnd system-associated protein 4